MTDWEMKHAVDVSDETKKKTELIRGIFPGYERLMIVAQSVMGEFFYGAAKQIRDATAGMNGLESWKFIKQSPLYRLLEETGATKLMFVLPGQNLSLEMPSRGQLLKIFGRLCIAVGDYVTKTEKAGKK